MSYPDPSQVLEGVVYGASDELTGTLQDYAYTAVFPDPSDVTNGTEYGLSGADFTGIYVQADSSLYLAGNYFGPASAWEGTLNPDDHADLPEVGEVLLSVVYGYSGNVGTLDPILYIGGGDYCLTTSSIATGGTSGTINPATVMASNPQGTLDLANVAVSAGGTLTVTSKTVVIPFAF